MEPQDADESRLAKVQAGEICAACSVPFTEAHKRPVLCPACYDNNRGRPRWSGLPKAWYEVL